jgi:hypothetical protein
MQDDASNGGSVWKVAAIAFGMIAVGACAYSYVLYGALASDLAAGRNDVRLAQNEIANLNTQLRLMEEQAEAQQEQLQGKHARLAAQSGRNLPIDLTFFEAGRSGKVALLHNLSDADIEVMLEVQSPASRSDVRRPLVINARGMLQIGPAEGWRFAPGQIVSLNKDKYRSLVRIVS